MSAPWLGKWFRGIHASERNPQRDGMYVRTVVRPSGTMNPGTFYELTDGKGSYWQYPVEALVPLPMERRRDAVTDDQIKALRDLFGPTAASGGGRAVLVDTPEAEAILALLDERDAWAGAEVYLDNEPEAIPADGLCVTDDDPKDCIVIHVEEGFTYDIAIRKARALPAEQGGERDGIRI